jgi:hypothetical protein
MTWNYRVLRTADESGEPVYRIHEVYYDDDGSIDGWTVEPVQPLGESLSELREDIRYFLAAFRSPVLEEAEEDGKPVLQPSDEEQEINEGHYFELMDRASVALDHCYQFVGSHPVTRRHETLRELYEKAEEALYRVYQEAARLELERGQD